MAGDFFRSPPNPCQRLVPAAAITNPLLVNKLPEFREFAKDPETLTPQKG
jgi:hypothetical protein